MRQPDYTNDPNRSDHFQHQITEAWAYLEKYISTRMLTAKDERGRSGYWTGGNIPAGYILDLEEKLPNGEPNPKYHHYIPYEPHAEAVRWLFKRYKELNGNLKALLSEIKAKPCLFPDFQKSIPPLILAKFTQYRKVEGGYTITTTRTLSGILTNRAYIGYWVYQGEVVNIHNHPMLVDLITFAYTYDHLSGIPLDGISRS